MTCSKPSCSATRGARSPARSWNGQACSRTPIRERSSSTRSASSPRGPRRSCSASCRKGKCAESERITRRKVDVRIVAATNRSLQGEVVSGRFRADLRFRLDVIRIRIPPLRERPDEVPWLAGMFWADAARRVGTQATLSSDLVSALARYDWPGNVRELQNVIAALSVHAPRRGRVGASLLPAHVAGLAARATTTFDEARMEFERRFVRAALARTGGRKAAAAGQLGVSRQGLAKMMKRLGIADP